MSRVRKLKLILWTVTGLATAVGLQRFLFGLGAATNLSDAYPWGVWIGFDDKTSTGDTRSGSTNALPIWAEFMNAYHEGKPWRDFEPPAGIVFTNVCLESGELATEHCTRTRLEVFREENEPQVPCHLHASGTRRKAPDGRRIQF